MFWLCHEYFDVAELDMISHIPSNYSNKTKIFEYFLLKMHGILKTFLKILMIAKFSGNFPLILLKYF